MRAAFLNAIQAAMDRSRELARGELSRGGRRAPRRATTRPPAAAELLAEAARAEGHVALSGGSTVGAAYELAARLQPRWTGAHVWFGDERAVPPDDERSNYRLVAYDAARRARACRPRCTGSTASCRRGGGGGAVRRRARRRDARPGAERDRRRTVTRRRSFPARRRSTSASAAPSRPRPGSSRSSRA